VIASTAPLRAGSGAVSWLGILRWIIRLLLFFLALLLLLVALPRLVPAFLQCFGQRVADFLQHLFFDFLQASRALVGREGVVLDNLLQDFGVALHDFAIFPPVRC
jgi:hypothetical protein